MHTIDLEIAIAHHFNYRRNLIVPNVYWGMGFNHECDLLVLTPAGYAWEIEIKRSRPDLRRDIDKRHKHNDYLNRIKYLYFAIPESLVNSIDLIPTRAGILVVEDVNSVSCIRKPEAWKNARKWTERERRKLLHLTAMRIWNLKRSLKEKQ